VGIALRAPQSMQVELVIDSREGALSKYVNTLVGAGINGVALGKRSMDLGDVQILLRHDGAVVRTLVFERKTLPDLVSSIHDGRYREQKSRLLATTDTCNVAYIIEGDSLCASLRREPKNISSAYMNMMFRFLNDLQKLLQHEISPKNIKSI